MRSKRASKQSRGALNSGLCDEEVIVTKDVERACACHFATDQRAVVELVACKRPPVGLQV